MAIEVTMLAEAVLDRLWWSMGLRVGIVFECLLVVIGVSVGGLLVVACRV